MKKIKDHCCSLMEAGDEYCIEKEDFVLIGDEHV